MRAQTRQTITYFLAKTAPYTGIVATALTGVVVGSLSGDIIYGLIFKDLFDILFAGLDAPGAITQAYALLFYLAGSILFLNIGYRTCELCINYQQPATMRDIENDVFEKLQDHSYAFFADHFGGALVTKTNRLVRAYERISDLITFDFLPLAVKMVFIVAILSYFSLWLGMLMLGWVLFYLVVFSFLYRWKFRYDTDLANADSRVTAHLADSITNVINTKVFAQKGFEQRRFFKASFERFRKRKINWDMNTKINILQGALMLAAEVGLLYMAIRLWSQGAISTGTIVLLQIYVLAIMRSLWGFGRFIRDLFRAFADAEEMIEIIHETPSLVDTPHPQECTIKEGKIEFAHVDFHYDTKKVFSAFNLTIASKQSIGLVGESGAGKSTITKMLLRFADVSAGTIRIDGQDIRELTQADVRRNISYVPQDSILFHRSLRENIAYSRPDATMEEVVAAAKKANVHSFIESLPQGYRTLVGERGIKLSGGERQRVAIARAMLKNAPIVIFDEATSSLDSKSETLIQKAMENLMKNRTTIIVAHRLSTIKKVDRILVLDHGKIIEDGTHEKLLRKKGKYHELWDHQTSMI